MGIFGGGKSQQSSQQTSGSTASSMSQSASDNQAYPWLKDQYTPQVQQGTQTNSLLGDLLGINPSQHAGDALAEYRNTTGFQDQLDTGTRAITNTNATHGLLGSGATAKALYKFGAGLAENNFGDYISKLLALSQNGLSAGSLIAGAGNRSAAQTQSNSSSYGQGTSQGTSVQNPDLSKLIGSAMMAIA